MAHDYNAGLDPKVSVLGGESLVARAVVDHVKELQRVWLELRLHEHHLVDHEAASERVRLRGHLTLCPLDLAHHPLRC